MAETTTLTSQPSHRATFGALPRRLSYTESFSTYRHTDTARHPRPLWLRGPGCALVTNTVGHWRRRFVIEESIEVDCAVLTPGCV